MPELDSRWRKIKCYSNWCDDLCLDGWRISKGMAIQIKWANGRITSHKVVETHCKDTGQETDWTHWINIWHYGTKVLMEVQSGWLARIEQLPAKPKKASKEYVK